MYGFHEKIAANAGVFTAVVSLPRKVAYAYTLAVSTRSNTLNLNKVLIAHTPYHWLTLNLKR